MSWRRFRRSPVVFHGVLSLGDKFSCAPVLCSFVTLVPLLPNWGFWWVVATRTHDRSLPSSSPSHVSARPPPSPHPTHTHTHAKVTCLAFTCATCSPLLHPGWTQDVGAAAPTRASQAHQVGQGLCVAYGVGEAPWEALAAACFRGAHPHLTLLVRLPGAPMPVEHAPLPAARPCPRGGWCAHFAAPGACWRLATAAAPEGCGCAPLRPSACKGSLATWRSPPSLLNTCQRMRFRQPQQAARQLQLAAGTAAAFLHQQQLEALLQPLPPVWVAAHSSRSPQLGRNQLPGAGLSGLAHQRRQSTASRRTFCGCVPNLSSVALRWGQR
jgi:hypothetical protein